jgi:putative transposase
MSKVNKIFEEDNNNPEIQAVKKAMKETKQKRMFIRYQVILYHLKGYTNIEISAFIDLAQHTVGNYIKKYKQSGLDGLVMRHSPGAPRMLTDEQEQKLYDIISTKTPDEVGFEYRKNWTSSLAVQWVKANFEVEYSINGMLDLLHRIKLSYTRPTYTLAKADPEKQEAFKQEFEGLKKPS